MPAEREVAAVPRRRATWRSARGGEEAGGEDCGRGGPWTRRTVTVDSAEGNGRGWVSRLKTGSFK